MTSNLDEKGLRSIVAEYDLFFIDIWGVLHNGLNLFQNSVEVLEELEKISKEVLQEFVANDDFAKEIYQSILEFKKGVSNYHKISEQAIYDLR